MRHLIICDAVRFALVAALTLSGWDAFSQDGDPSRESPSPLDQRILRDWVSLEDPFVITPHKPNYILPLAYNSRPNDAPFSGLQESLDNLEMKFQLSLKLLAWRDIFDENGHLVFGYTQQAYWQAYNKGLSSPFRETDHEPEAVLGFLTDFGVLGFRNRVLNFGIVHQSNGRSGGFSRSWNRIYAEIVLVRDSLVLALKPWRRLPEDAGDDDNPDIEDYMGHGEVTAVYKTGRSTFSLMLRNNLDTGDNRGAVQLDWSYPVKDGIRGYVQYFNGYGESLIDYNASVNRIGMGLMLSDWL